MADKSMVRRFAYRAAKRAARRSVAYWEWTKRKGLVAVHKDGTRHKSWCTLAQIMAVPTVRELQPDEEVPRPIKWE